MTEKIHWGISTIGCPDLSLQEAADLGKQSGYPVLEIRVLNDSFPEKALLKELVAQKRCMILGSSFGLVSQNQETLNIFKHHCELASECGVPYIRVFGGHGFAEGISDQDLANAASNLQAVESWHLPIQLALETHDCLASAKRVCRLFESLQRHLPVIWDTFHTFFTGNESLQEAWGMLKQDIIDIHVKDGLPSPMTLPGKGNFPLAQLFQMLQAENYSGMITCEHEKMWHRELPELPDVLKALDTFKKLL